MPASVNPRVPAPLTKVPLKVLLMLLAPAVKVTGAATLSVPFPAPANEPTLLEKPLRSRVEDTVKAEFELKPVVEPACSVPALTEVNPLEVLAPESVRVPVPILVSRMPTPLIRFPLKVVLVFLPPTVKFAEVDPALLVTVPVPANEPTLLEKPLMSRVEFTVK